MSDSLDFYFDFSSPYGYLAAERIDGIAAKHGRTATWRPFLLGAVFQKIGGSPLVDQPMKGPYSRHDMLRSGACTVSSSTSPITSRSTASPPAALSTGWRRAMPAERATSRSRSIAATSSKTAT